MQTREGLRRRDVMQNIDGELPLVSILAPRPLDGVFEPGIRRRAHQAFNLSRLSLNAILVVDLDRGDGSGGAALLRSFHREKRPPDLGKFLCVKAFEARADVFVVGAGPSVNYRPVRRTMVLLPVALVKDQLQPAVVLEVSHHASGVCVGRGVCQKLAPKVRPVASGVGVSIDYLKISPSKDHQCESAGPTQIGEAERTQWRVIAGRY